MLVYKFRRDGVYVGETLEIVGEGWPLGTTPIAPPAEVTGTYYVFNGMEWLSVEGTVPEIIDIDQLELNRSTAVILLGESDWVENPSVSDTSNDPHLMNLGEWISYRVALRGIATKPTDAKDVVFPTKPEQKWSNQIQEDTPIEVTRV